MTMTMAMQSLDISDLSATHGDQVLESNTIVLGEKYILSKFCDMYATGLAYNTIALAECTFRHNLTLITPFDPEVIERGLY